LQAKITDSYAAFVVDFIFANIYLETNAHMGAIGLVDRSIGLA